MKRTMQFLIAAVMLLPLFSCHRRPLTTADYTVRLDINIDRDIVNYEMPRDPEIMRVAFYDHNTGQLFTQAFLPPTGGEVNIVPERTYDILVYNFDTEVTLIKDENDWTKILATTNTISDAFKSKLKSRGTKSPFTKQLNELKSGSNLVGEWVAGSHYIYNITFGAAAEIEIEPSVKGWDRVSVENISAAN